jgi:hypothetical protein
METPPPTSESGKVSKAQSPTPGMQLTTATNAGVTLERALRDVESRAQAVRAASCRVEAVYREVGRLADRGIEMVVSGFVATEITAILEQVKPAGALKLPAERAIDLLSSSAPVSYPDLLVVLAVVRTGLRELRSELTVREQIISRRLNEAFTIAAALEYLIDKRILPSDTDLLDTLDRSHLATEWFTERHGERIFDEQRLDRTTLDSHLAPPSAARYVRPKTPRPSKTLPPTSN